MPDYRRAELLDRLVAAVYAVTVAGTTLGRSAMLTIARRRPLYWLLYVDFCVCLT
jgi:hypothetical protein